MSSGNDFIKTAVAILVVCSLSGCSSDEEQFGFRDGVFISILKEQDRRAGENDLRNIEKLPNLEKFKGGFLFDGQVVTKLNSDSHGQPRWRVRVDKVYQDNRHKDYAIIRCPTVENGGAILEEGARYRLYVVDTELIFLDKSGDPFFWRGTFIPLK